MYVHLITSLLTPACRHPLFVYSELLLCLKPRNLSRRTHRTCSELRECLQTASAVSRLRSQIPTQTSKASRSTGLGAQGVCPPHSPAQALFQTGREKCPSSGTALRGHPFSRPQVLPGTHNWGDLAGAFRTQHTRSGLPCLSLLFPLITYYASSAPDGQLPIFTH